MTLDLEETKLSNAARRMVNRERDIGPSAHVALAAAELELKTQALRYTAAMIRESGERGTIVMASDVERLADYTESLIANVRQGDG